MSTISIALVIFLCVYGAALLGVLLHSVLPQSHRTPETREVVKVSVGLVATMSALLLGLLVASAKGTYDVQQGRTIQMAAKVTFLDRSLGLTGPDSATPRTQLKGDVASLIERIWPSDRFAAPDLKPDFSSGNLLYTAITQIKPENDEQHAAKSIALKTIAEIAELYGLIHAQAGNRIPMTLLIVVVTWLAIAFVSFGLFAPANGTSLTALTVAAMAVSAALFLILELDRAFGGLIGISSGPMKIAFEQLGG